jgi:diacylglycerol kinase (ATP)
LSVALVFNARAGSDDSGARSRVAKELAKEVSAAAEAADAVVAAGGDGTLSLLVNALGDRLGDVALGVVPLGTGNDFARTLGLPDKPEEAAAAVARGRTRPVDVGRISGVGGSRLFVNSSLGGFPVHVDREIDEEVKKKLGPLAFWIAGAKAATDLERSTVAVNGRAVRECVAVGIGNGRSAGGGIEMWPEARIDDGLLDACLLPISNVREAARLAVKVRAGEHVDIEGVVTVRDRRLEIDCDGALEFNVDGELPGIRAPATFEIVARADFLAAPPGPGRI